MRGLAVQQVLDANAGEVSKQLERQSDQGAHQKTVR
jgi:hypothetical protein